MTSLLCRRLVVMPCQGTSRLRLKSEGMLRKLQRLHREVRLPREILLHILEAEWPPSLLHAVPLLQRLRREARLSRKKLLHVLEAKRCPSPLYVALRLQRLPREVHLFRERLLLALEARWPPGPQHAVPQLLESIHLVTVQHRDGVHQCPESTLHVLKRSR